MVPPLSKRDGNSQSTPPPELRGSKHLHSPWSAQRSRKRQATLGKSDPAPLAIIEEDYASPPKRRNGGTSPAARELQLPKLPFDAAQLEAAGPLGQGLLLQATTGSADGFSPLASGMRASFTFTAGVSTSSAFPVGALAQQQPQKQPQEGAAVGPSKRTAPAATVPPAVAAAGPAPVATAQGTIVVGGDSVAGPLELAECSYGALSRAWTAPPLAGAADAACHSLDHARPMSQLTDRSRRSHGEADVDMRSSWGSERSADVLPWREMQARLHDEHALLQSARRRQGGGGDAHGTPRGAAAHDPMRASADSLRDSLEMPSCTERQASIIPLRTSMKGHWQQSHLPTSPVAAARSRRLPNTQSPALQRPIHSGQKHKGTCFLCPSPFCKPQRYEAEEAAEVVRRTESDEFVLHRTQSFDATSRERPTAGKLRRESLNRPPSPAELVHRQDGFSAKCCTTPVHLLSPQSAYSDEDGLPFDHSPEIEPAPSAPELLACLRDQSKNPTIDELNDMLRTFCTLDFHPKDAEELVEEACKTCQLAPNATTLRTLDKIWAAHEQMYG